MFPFIVADLYIKMRQLILSTAFIVFKFRIFELPIFEIWNSKVPYYERSTYNQNR